MRKVYPLAFLLLGIFILFAGGIYYIYKAQNVQMQFYPIKKLYSSHDKLKVIIKVKKKLPLSRIKVFYTFGNERRILYEGKLQNIKLDLNFKELNQNEGELSVCYLLKNPFKENKKCSVPFKFDLKPPKIDLIFAPKRVKMGYPSLIVVTVDEEPKEIFLKYGNTTFPLIRYGKKYIGFFTIPLKYLNDYTQITPYIVASDAAGNKSIRKIRFNIVPYKVKIKKISLKEKSLQKLLRRFFEKIENPIEQFKIVNRVYRKEDEKKLLEICSKSKPIPLFNGTFLQLPGSKVESGFGEKRLYYFNGKFLGSSIHKGIDLAKYKNAPVVAANNGIVVFTGNLKVYGKVIIIDHGLGLFTLYGHLKDFKVKVGQPVKKGEVIGHTDTTGFALGDHLHFGVLIWGVATNPYFYFIPWNMNFYIYRIFNKYLKN